MHLLESNAALVINIYVWPSLIKVFLHVSLQFASFQSLQSCQHLRACFLRIFFENHLLAGGDSSSILSFVRKVREYIVDYIFFIGTVQRSEGSCGKAILFLRFCLGLGHLCSGFLLWLIILFLCLLLTILFLLGFFGRRFLFVCCLLLFRKCLWLFWRFSWLSFLFNFFWFGNFLVLRGMLLLVVVWEQLLGEESLLLDLEGRHLLKRIQRQQQEGDCRQLFVHF